MAEATVTPTHYEHMWDLSDTTALASRLRALLVAIYGEGGECFRRLRDDFQDNYIWQCAEMAEQLEKDLSQMAIGGRITNPTLIPPTKSASTTTSEQ